jgi:large subunit ribosomal protein L32e
MSKEKLIEVRKNIKRRKPTYKRVQSHQFPKLSEVKWRRPKGKGNKVRRGRAGKPSKPEVGFKSPKLVRGLSPNGFREVIISNLNDLKKINIKEEIAIISSRMGGKKKLDCLKYAKESKIKLGNIKSIDESIKLLTKEKKSEKTKETKKEDHKKAQLTKDEKKEGTIKDKEAKK